MEKLKTIEVTYEKSYVGDLVYVYTQNQNNYKNHPLRQEQVKGFVLYDKERNWNGFGFTYKNKGYRTIFNEEKGIHSENPTNFILDINDLGIFGIESIDALIKNIDYAKPYILEEEIN